MTGLEPVLVQTGEFLLAARSEDLEVQTKSTIRDLVTRADKESERRLVDFITDRFPSDGILAEEGSRRNPQAEFLWVIDPLDGTINYAHGLPLFNISVGIVYNGQPVAGMVYMPAIQELYQAIKGKGALLNKKPISVSRTTDLTSALVVTGFPYEREKYLEMLMEGVRRVLSHCRGLRRTGSAALDLCWLSAGRFDVLYEFFLNPWDICGGAAILREAGGYLTDVDGAPFTLETGAILASNSVLHEPALTLLGGLRKLL
ncbi:MAG: inositol monophosphatase [Spirochaetales bacterium]|nr:inositol monophosphatase [Spirochaetales bacterium]